jgi:hypothetical protein
MAITRSDELRHSPAGRDTKLASRVIVIIICSLNNILFSNLRLSLIGLLLYSSWSRLWLSIKALVV